MAADAADEPLKRLGGGRWRSRDERFTIEPQSGTWVVVDGDQVDDLGLPLVRGPFASLRDAKAAMAQARDGEPATSPLTGGVARPPKPGTPGTASAAAPGRGRPAKGGPPDQGPAPAPTPDPEPRWMAALARSDRRRARDLIDRLVAAGASDAEGRVRRDIVGDIPSIASFAIGRRLAELGPDASAADVVRLLVDGRDDDLDVRWRLVDGDGRPISDLSG